MRKTKFFLSILTAALAVIFISCPVNSKPADNFGDAALQSLTLKNGNLAIPVPLGEPGIYLNAVTSSELTLSFEESSLEFTLEIITVSDTAAAEYGILTAGFPVWTNDALTFSNGDILVVKVTDDKNELYYKIKILHDAKFSDANLQSVKLINGILTIPVPLGEPSASMNTTEASELSLSFE